MARTRALAAPAAGPRWTGCALQAGDPHVAKKRAILRAAASLFRERGYERTRLSDISDALNVTKPTLYYYVKNKEDILVEIQQTGLDEITDELNSLRRSAQSGADALRRVIARYANWATGEFGVCVARHFVARLSPENDARLRKARRTLDRRIRATIQRGIDDGSLGRCEPWVVTAAIVGAINWMAFWYDAGKAHRTAAEVGSAYFDLLVDGIGARGRRGAAARPRASGAS